MTNFSEQFARARSSLPGMASTAGIRAMAFERFNAEGLPDRRRESWRYTDLSGLRDAGYDLLAGAPAEQGLELLAQRLAQRRLLAGALQMVFIDGRFSAELSDPNDAPAYRIDSVRDRWDEVEPLLELRDGIEAHPLALLNTAFTEHGLLVQVPDNADIEQALTIVFAGSAADANAQQPRLLIRIGENASLTVLLHFFDCSEAASWTNVVTQVDQAAGSRLELYELQEHTGRQFHTELNQVVLGKDARFKGGFIDNGGRLTRRDLDVKLTAPGADAEIAGLFLALGGRHVDNHVSIDHLAAETSSSELFRGIAGAGGRGVFNGKVVVRPNAQRIAAHQRSDNLLLDATAEIDTKPELEIYADDVKCSHGATVGELDEQQLFYLQSRGIDAEAAHALLTFAFANNVLEQIGHDELRRVLSERIARSLPEHERWEQLT